MTMYQKKGSRQTILTGKGKRDIIYKIMTVLLLIFLSLCFSMIWTIKAESRSRSAALFDNSAYEQAEETYKEQVSEILAQYGCYYSGVTLTRVVSLDGEREYTASIHDARFSLMPGEELSALKQELARLKVVPQKRGAETVVIVLTGC